MHIFHCEFIANDNSYRYDIGEVFNKVSKRVKNKYYKINNINYVVNRAINDIKEFAKALDFDTQFYWFARYANEGKSKERLGKLISPHVFVHRENYLTGKNKYESRFVEINFFEDHLKVTIDKQMYVIAFSFLVYTYWNPLKVIINKRIYADGK